jgi:hypothetical protein
MKLKKVVLLLGVFAAGYLLANLICHTSLGIGP